MLLSALDLALTLTQGQMKIQLLSPLWLTTGIPLLAAAVSGRWLLLRYLRKQAGIEPVTDAEAVSSHGYYFPLFSPVNNVNLNPDSRHRKITLDLLLKSLVLLALLTALANPVKPGIKWAEKAQKRNIVILLDTSISMMQKDYLIGKNRIDRMTFAKGIAGRLINKFKGDKIAIILFSEHASILVPFTDDNQLLSNQLQRVETELTGRMNYLGSALATTLNYLANYQAGNKQGKTADEKPFRNIQVFLLTHGARPIGRFKPREIAALYARKNIKLYTLGIGGTVPVKSVTGNTQGKSRGLNFDPINTPLLKQIAQITNARFIWINSSSRIDTLIAKLKLQSRRVDKIRFRQVTETLYYWPLLFAMLCLMLLQIVKLTRNGAWY